MSIWMKAVLDISYLSRHIGGPRSGKNFIASIDPPSAKPTLYETYELE